MMNVKESASNVARATIAKPYIGARGVKPSSEKVFFALLLLAERNGTIPEMAEELRMTPQYAQGNLRSFQLRKSRFRKDCTRLADQLAGIEITFELVRYGARHLYRLPPGLVNLVRLPGAEQ